MGAADGFVRVRPPGTLRAPVRHTARASQLRQPAADTSAEASAVLAVARCAASLRTIPPARQPVRRGLRTIPRRMRIAATAPLLLFFCHPRPVNGYLGWKLVDLARWRDRAGGELAALIEGEYGKMYGRADPYRIHGPRCSRSEPRGRRPGWADATRRRRPGAARSGLDCLPLPGRASLRP
jgi:hypothetical protein